MDPHDFVSLWSNLTKSHRKKSNINENITMFLHEFLDARPHWYSVTLSSVLSAQVSAGPVVSSSAASAASSSETQVMLTSWRLCASFDLTGEWQQPSLLSVCADGLFSKCSMTDLSPPPSCAGVVWSKPQSSTSSCTPHWLSTAHSCNTTRYSQCLCA